MSTWSEEFSLVVRIDIRSGRGNEQKQHRLEFSWPAIASRADVGEALEEVAATVKNLPRGNGEVFSKKN